MALQNDTTIEKEVSETQTKSGYKNTTLGWVPEDWEVDTIENVLLIENNSRKPISEDIRMEMKGEYPYYGPTKIQDYINEYQYDGEYALIAEDGDHFLKYRELPMTQLVNGKFNVNNHAHALKGTDKCLTSWFYWFYNRKSIFSYLTRQGAGRYKLNKASLSKMKIVYPLVEEQMAIVDCLNIWDIAIKNLLNLIELKELQKKGLMQHLLTGKKRLKGFSYKWENKKLGDLIIEKNQKSLIHNEYPVLTSSQSGIYLQSEYFNKEVSSSNNSGYKILKRGQFTFRSMSDTGSFTFNMLEILEIGLISPAYSVFEFKNTNRYFMKFYLNNSFFTKHIKSVSQGGTRVALKLNGLRSIVCPLPSIDEQNEIADLLQKADQEIALLNKKLFQLKQQKKGLMQQLLTGKKRLKF